MFIRFFADTTGSHLSLYALEYMRSFMRIAPVRLVSVTGQPAGRWGAYGMLMVTPMAGPCINAVCCDPSRWTWVERVPASERPVNVGELLGPENTDSPDHKELGVPAVAETITGRVELYTQGLRNILFAVAPPRSKLELASAMKYEAIVVPTEMNASGWRTNGREPIVLGVPTLSGGSSPSKIDHARMREIFIPPPQPGVTT